MKVFGWVLVVFSIMGFVCILFSSVNYPAEKVESAASGALTSGVLGLFLISRANKKIKEKQDKNNWSNN